MVKLEIKFVDEFGNITELKKERELFPDLGDDALNLMEVSFNEFLKAIGYDFSKDKVLLESLTDKEHEKLIQTLWEMRGETI